MTHSLLIILSILLTNDVALKETLFSNEHVTDAFGIFFRKTARYTAIFLENGRGKAVNLDDVDHEILDLKSKKYMHKSVANNDYLPLGLHSIPTRV